VWVGRMVIAPGVGRRYSKPEASASGALFFGRTGAQQGRTGAVGVRGMHGCDRGAQGERRGGTTSGECDLTGFSAG